MSTVLTSPGRALLAVLLLGCLAACAAPDGGSRTLRVASDLDNPPFALVDGAGQPAGRDVEMMEALAARSGLELVWVRMPFDALLDAVERGEVDVVCATLGITPERAERVRFTRPYFRTAIAVVVRSGGPRTPGDLAGRVVHAARGTTSERAVLRHLSAALLHRGGGGGDASDGDRDGGKGADVEALLLGGSIDAAVLDGPAADALAARSGGRLVRMDEDLASEDYALALPPGAAALTARLDATLLALEAEGALAELDRRHGLRSEARPAESVGR